MKKIILSAAVAAMALSTSAFAADKGIDIVTTGQAVVYYNTAANDSQDLFSATEGVDNTRANFGVQLNLDADLKNGFTFGSQINYIGTLGLEKNLVNGVMQTSNNPAPVTEDGLPISEVDSDRGIADDIYLSKIFIAKQIGNTTVKLGRQELPKSLSPFAYSEGWNVFKNTFDAALVINTDIPDTTLVGAYVAGSNGNGFGNDMSDFDNLSVNNNAISGDAGFAINGTAYMLTAQNKSVPMTTITATYYDVNKVAGASDNSATIIWADAAIASKDLPMGLKVGLQGGQISPDLNAATEAAIGEKDTTAFGLKASIKPIDALTVCAAYSSVDDGTVQIRNTGGVKTPLYTQMIANQGSIALDNDTIMLKGVYNTGDYGKIILQGTQSSDNSSASDDLLDIELVYKVNVASMNVLVAYINQDFDTDARDTDIVRVVARYNF